MFLSVELSFRRPIYPKVHPLGKLFQSIKSKTSALFRKIPEPQDRHDTTFVCKSVFRRADLANNGAWLVWAATCTTVNGPTAQPSRSNGDCRSDLYRAATGSHMPRTFSQRVTVGKIKRTPRRCTLMRHDGLRLTTSATAPAGASGEQ